MTRPAIFILGVSALGLARKLKTLLDGEIHGPVHLIDCDFGFAEATRHLAQLFRDGRTIVGLCASGILIRAVAPHLRDKHVEPPVVAVAEDGSSAVPLLGGHHGANALARRIAEVCGGHAAITTASDVRFETSFDEPPAGHVLGNPADVKGAVAAKLAGENVRIEVTERAIAGSSNRLVYHPRTLAIGLGCERGASADDAIALVRSICTDKNLATASIACIASIDIKCDEAAIHEAAEHFGVPVRFFSAAELARETPRLKNPSEIVEREVGVPGVAEAAALAAAGDESELLVAKTKGARVTCAIARAPAPILQLPGRPRGKLSVVGIGPGARDYRSPAARAALVSSSDWVGYDLYLNLIADLKEGQIEHRFPLGGEEDRVRHTINLANKGKQVSLVCSGDAGIYAMASLVYEIVEREPCRIEIEVVPGISAFQAAAAKAGAMIGHDFCCISLSDLLTPWETIEKRIEAAARGDFVVAIYNPRSLKRREQLDRAMAILGRHRPPDVPVVIASNLCRAEEKVKIVPLADVDSDDVDMLTLVMVGSSQSKSFKRGDGKTYAYTPRGYTAKREVCA
jgi:cobalt-precorrin 5A hydrolase/precorrin-3B C17-methyltransferase